MNGLVDLKTVLRPNRSLAFRISINWRYLERISFVWSPCKFLPGPIKRSLRFTVRLRFVPSGFRIQLDIKSQDQHPEVVCMHLLAVKVPVNQGPFTFGYGSNLVSGEPIILDWRRDELSPPVFVRADYQWAVVFWVKWKGGADLNPHHIPELQAQSVIATR